MPHVVVKLYAGRTDAQKAAIAEAVTRVVIESAGCGADAVSVAVEGVDPQDWMDKVYRPDIAGRMDTLLRKPGYGSAND